MAVFAPRVNGGFEMFPRQARESLPSALLRGDADRWFEDFFGDRLRPGRWFGTEQDFAPALDIKETPEAFEVEADIPGIEPKDLRVEANEGRLRIHGERKHEVDEKTENYHRKERLYGTFERQIALPPSADLERIEARVDNGVLHLTVPKKQSTQPRAIEIKGGNS